MSAAERLDETLLALADPARRRVIELLRSKPRRAGDLANELDMVPPAMSRHLRVLRTSGLVEEAPLPEDARVRVYRLRAEPFSELRMWLDEVEAFWTDQLHAFKAHAERRSAPSGARAISSRKRPIAAGPRRTRKKGATR
jgi:DNA-binding transcriptional ArsR family regulator